MEARTHDVLDAAYEVGVRYLDVARSYGDAEAFLGDWLAARDPHDVVVGSKWGYTYVGGWRLDADVQEVKDLSVAALRRQIAESRRLLGDRLSLYQIHSATLESGVFDDREVLDELRSIRGAGLVLGFSTSGPKQADAIVRGLQERVDGEPLFSTVQSTWNVLEPSAGPALAEAHADGRGVLIKEAMANGRLAATDGPLAGMAGRLGTTPDRVALAAVRAQPWADVVLSGAVTVEQVRSNASAVEVVLPDDALAAMNELAQPPERYWADRAALPWR
jgi:aryl-alcohol dehydrogenase-like predicted oxidoreductase